MSFGQKFFAVCDKNWKKNFADISIRENFDGLGSKKILWKQNSFFLSEKAKKFGPLFLTSTQLSSCNKLNLNNFFFSFNRTWVSESWRKGGGVGFELRPPHFRQILGLNWSQLLTNGKLKRRRFTVTWQLAAGLEISQVLGSLAKKNKAYVLVSILFLTIIKILKTEVTVIVKKTCNWTVQLLGSD